jgi:ribosomal protein L37AE/L43A
MSMKWQPRRPQRLGAAYADSRERERAALAEIDKARGGPKCPSCGSEKYFPEAGCWVCKECGYSPCK